MKWALIFLAATPLLADEPTLPAGADPRKVAQELVAKLRSATPQENSVINGTLTIKPREGDARTVPVECTIRVEKGSWRSGYQTYGSNGVPERAVIVHKPGALNEYRFGRGTKCDTRRNRRLRQGVRSRPAHRRTILALCRRPAAG